MHLQDIEVLERLQKLSKDENMKTDILKIHKKLDEIIDFINKNRKGLLQINDFLKKTF